METPTVRLIDRMEEPSTRRLKIMTRLYRGNLFIPLMCELLCLPSSTIVIYRHFNLGARFWERLVEITLKAIPRLGYTHDSDCLQ